MMMLIAFLNVVVLIVMLEMIPLFLATEKQYGGLAYDQKHIGTVLLIAAIPILPIELTLILKIVKVNGPRNGLIWSSVGQMIFIPLLPLIHHIQNATVQLVMVILYIFIMNGIIFSLFYISFSSALLNIVKPTEMGILSGIGMCNASLARIFGPAIFGPMYSWSLKNKEYRDPKDGMVHFTSLGFPLDIYFVFISLSFISFCTILLIKFMLKIK
uniref:Uncharacterized protein n=1 Tax=Clytia hemisphaerica TaxID=252671 RepID=A0A7M5VAK4_9CNID|eukprot:TCONS_00019835-protein